MIELGLYSGQPERVPGRDQVYHEMGGKHTSVVNFMLSKKKRRNASGKMPSDRGLIVVPVIEQIVAGSTWRGIVSKGREHLGRAVPAQAGQGGLSNRGRGSESTKGG